ncbi:MAG: glycoside hydrolase family 32 protein [Bacteroidia bacterium]|nr:glycoside hydrolase family 32 protein [Bacteroidia bacterium]
MNEKQILSKSIPFAGFEELIIGKDERKNAIGIFPLNFFNGITDEVTVFNKSFNQNDFASLRLSEVLVKQPDLNVPAIRFADDFNRPKYHLIPAANWTNESHGLIYYNGRYHIFNQKDGNNLLLRNINWGHFSSPDLLHWTEHRPAILRRKDMIKWESGQAIALWIKRVNL